MKNKEDFYSLDFFRGFCGYGVAISHLYAFVFKNLYSEYISSDIRKGASHFGLFRKKDWITKNGYLINS